MTATGEFTRTPAHDTTAERFVLAAMIQSPVAREEAGEILDPEDFWLPAHQVIYLAMIVMHAGGLPVDPVTVKDWILSGGEMRALGGMPAGPVMLSDLWGLPVAAAGIGYHAAVVHDCAVRRKLEEAVTRVRQRLDDPGDSTTLDIIGRIQDDLAAAARRACETVDPLAGQVTGRAFTTTHRVVLPPVIPGLLHRQDRAVIIGGEGQGKSTLLDQIAVMAVAGLHPFTHSEVPPARVLIIDLENPRDLLQDRLSELMALGEHYPRWDDDALRVWSVPEGVDVRKPGDAYRISAQIRKASPDLVLAGPVGKMFIDSGERADHGTVTRFWDQMRVRFGFALLLEHHPPMATGVRRNWRPAGSGIWASWPEVGLALTPAPKDQPEGALNVITFRGHRRPGRLWPDMLHRNLMPGRGWPWLARYPEGTFADRLPEEDR